MHANRTFSLLLGKDEVHGQTKMDSDRDWTYFIILCCVMWAEAPAKALLPTTHPNTSIDFEYLGPLHTGIMEWPLQLQINTSTVELEADILYHTCSEIEGVIQRYKRMLATLRRRPAHSARIVILPEYKNHFQAVESCDKLGPYCNLILFEDQNAINPALSLMRKNNVEQVYVGYKSHEATGSIIHHDGFVSQNDLFGHFAFTIQSCESGFSRIGNRSHFDCMRVIAMDSQKESQEAACDRYASRPFIPEAVSDLTKLRNFKIHLNKTKFNWDDYLSLVTEANGRTCVHSNKNQAKPLNQKQCDLHSSDINATIPVLCYMPGVSHRVKVGSKQLNESLSKYFHFKPGAISLNRKERTFYLHNSADLHRPMCKCHIPKAHRRNARERIGFMITQLENRRLETEQRCHAVMRKLLKSPFISSENYQHYVYEFFPDDLVKLMVNRKVRNKSDSALSMSLSILNKTNEFLRDGAQMFLGIRDSFVKTAKLIHGMIHGREMNVKDDSTRMKKSSLPSGMEQQWNNKVNWMKIRFKQLMTTLEDGDNEIETFQTPYVSDVKQQVKMEQVFSSFMETRAEMEMFIEEQARKVDRLKTELDELVYSLVSKNFNYHLVQAKLKKNARALPESHAYLYNNDFDAIKNSRTSIEVEEDMIVATFYMPIVDTKHTLHVWKGIRLPFLTEHGKKKIVNYESKYVAISHDLKKYALLKPQQLAECYEDGYYFCERLQQSNVTNDVCILEHFFNDTETPSTMCNATIINVFPYFQMDSRSNLHYMVEEQLDGMKFCENRTEEVSINGNGKLHLEQGCTLNLDGKTFYGHQSNMIQWTKEDFLKVFSKDEQHVPIEEKLLTRKKRQSPTMNSLTIDENSRVRSGINGLGYLFIIITLVYTLCMCSFVLEEFCNKFCPCGGRCASDDVEGEEDEEDLKSERLVGEDVKEEKPCIREHGTDASRMICNDLNTRSKNNRQLVFNDFLIGEHNNTVPSFNGAGTSTPITFTDEDFEEYNEVLRLTNESQQKEDIHILKRTVQKPCKSVEAAAVNQNQRIEVNNMSQWDKNETSIVPFDIRTTKKVINNDSGVETSIIEEEVNGNLDGRIVKDQDDVNEEQSFGANPAMDQVEVETAEGPKYSGVNVNANGISKAARSKLKRLH